MKYELSPFCSNKCRNKAIEKDKEDERLQAQRAESMDDLDRTLAYCKRVGITYEEYQIQQTLSLLIKDEK